MTRLIVIPTQFEIDPFLAGCAELGFDVEQSKLGRLPIVSVPQLDIAVGVGGFGKSQFAVQTQHLIDAGPDWSAVLCVGAAGALEDGLAIGDVVVATETVEHDIRRSSGKPHPRFSGSPALIDELRAVESSAFDFGVHFATVASGDEDVNNSERRDAIQSLTGASAVRGKARAARERRSSAGCLSPRCEESPIWQTTRSVQPSWKTCRRRCETSSRWWRSGAGKTADSSPMNLRPRRPQEYDSTKMLNQVTAGSKARFVTPDRSPIV